tara:strand:+ start:473 stop:1003 length:531 start_codon:yes stop_codon:yes gene_type:complete
MINDTQNLLVLAGSNGENLKLAKRFVQIGKRLERNSKLIDLTELDLPLFNPRTKDNYGKPKDIEYLNYEMSKTSHWVICAPEYNGSIPPVLTSALAWLSIQGEDFRYLFNGRPIAIASFSGGGCMELMISLRIQLTHLGANVLSRQITSNNNKPAKDTTIEEIINLLSLMPHIKGK